MSQDQMADMDPVHLLRQIRNLLRSVIRRDDPPKERSDTGAYALSGNLIVGSKTVNVPFQAFFRKGVVYTLMFGIDNAGAEAGAHAVARVTWMTNGVQTTRQFDINQGVQISAPMESVNVLITDNTFLGEATGGTKYVVSMTVAPYPRAPSGQSPTITVVDPATGTQFNVAASTTKNVPIPQGVGVVAVNVTVSATPVNTVIPEGSVQVVQASAVGSLRTYDPRTTEWVPIAPGAQTLELINNFGPGTSLQFSVTFLIDG